MPYAVALAKGFFKETGADVSGVIGSNGGGADVRNLLAGQLAYAESAPISPCDHGRVEPAPRGSWSPFRP